VASTDGNFIGQNHQLPTSQAATVLQKYQTYVIWARVNGPVQKQFTTVNAAK